MNHHPSVITIIPTRDRPILMRRAIESVLAQEYPGRNEVVVVFDQAQPDWDLLEEYGPRLRVLRNTGTPGLAGARNRGLTVADSELVAFLDDDDYWVDGKLARQVGAYLENGRPGLVTTAIAVDFDGRRSVRLAGTSRVTIAHLTRSRMAMLHSSTFLFDRQALLDLGGVDESSPWSQNEDWDLLLRFAKRAPIVHVDEPLVIVTWGRASFFARRWESRNESLRWVLDKHPEIREDAIGLSRAYGQLAFGEAALGRRRAAWRLTRRALAAHPLQWRGWASLPVVVYPPSSEWIMNTLHRFGHGV